MYVTKRNATTEPVYYDKITTRIQKLVDPSFESNVYPARITQKIASGLFNSVHTKEIDQLAAETCASMSMEHPDYALLAARIAISNLQKETLSDFEQTLQILYTETELIDPALISFVQTHKERIQQELDYNRDFHMDYFAFKTLERSYLLRAHSSIIERPQHMWMRVALAIHNDDIEAAIQTYRFLSQKYFTQATPTLFNAGTINPQLSSCFLLTMKEDSIHGIYETLKRCALISKAAGGIGLSIHSIRATKSPIHGTNGFSNGIIPMLRVFNETARYVDQGGGRRKGAFAIYLEPWHYDIEDFLLLRKNRGKEELRARDLFYGLWIPDLFMKRVEQDQQWTLFQQDFGLSDLWGEAFENQYIHLENQQIQGTKQISARKLWFAILESQIETGNPYMLYKDACNKKNNQQHIGTLKTSNLCTEILEYVDPNEVAVCNLASISLPACVQNETFQFSILEELVQVLVQNLNKIIDKNAYPIPEAKTSNFRHRPIGIGVQGLADVFILLRYPYDSQEAKDLNRQIFEHIYFTALQTSCNLAKTKGYYESFPGSFLSKGIFQYDLWNETPVTSLPWEKLRQDVRTFGTQNSLLVALMPTASTSQILGNNESFEPYTSNIFTRKTLSGDFPVINKHLVHELVRLNIWSNDIQKEIIRRDGSVQGIPQIPKSIQNIFKTVWEISNEDILKMAADRAPFIDQSQSLNIFMSQPTTEKLTTLHFRAWKYGLKTGMYYFRTRSTIEANPNLGMDLTKKRKCSEDPDCLSCGA